MTSIARSRSWRPVADYVDQSIAETELRTKFPEIGHLSTGMDSLDTHLGPVLDGGKLLTIAGASGSGKTTFMNQLATVFASQTRVLLFSLEDDPVDGVRRPLAALSNTSVTSMRSGFANGKVVPDELYAAAARLSELQLDIVEETGDVLTIGATIREWSEASADTSTGASILPRVVLIDQLSHISLSPMSVQILRTLTDAGIPIPAAGAREHELLEWICAVLRYISRKYNLLIVLAVQLNNRRDDADGRPTQESIRLSQGIVHKSDSVLAVWRPKSVPNPAWQFSNKKDTAKTLPNDQGRTWILDLKARLTDGEDVELVWDGPHQRFSDPAAAGQLLHLPVAASGRGLEGYRKLSELRQRFDVSRTSLTPTDIISMEAIEGKSAVLDDGQGPEWLPSEEDEPSA
jgi:energy-coupling factor transporter ATP-binding protein EcfA2